jgi:uncharacterized membrane protein YhhN
VTRPPTIVFIVLTAIACMALVYFLRVEWPLLAAGAKIIASTGFLATAISVGALSHRFGQAIFAGLLLSFFGDVFLIGMSERAFLSGLGFFLLAHIAYIVAFVIYGYDRKWAIAAAIPIAAITVIVAIWLTPHIPADLLIPVRVYSIVIGLMVIAAFGAKGAGASSLIVAGALMFFVSDLSVAATRLVQVSFPTIVWGLPLYYAGQLCLAVSARKPS